MGVHGLWELLSPVGHRVSNDSVRNKVLAVDVSIWLTQFVKAMRDAEGAQVRNSHLLGVFRRCVKLLYLSVKPVFVFDGATPTLKRRTLSSRRAQREKHAAKLRRLAEKMLLNRIKQETVDRAIAKKRKGKLHAASIVPQKSLFLQNGPTDTSQDLTKGELMSSDGASCVEESVQLHQPSEKLTATEESLPDAPSEMASDVFHESSDTDDAEINLPQNVDDLDDDVLMKLPTKMQAEVFKQVKLEQRARHRENMMLKQQNPSEFSKMQIEGFLRHTALNRKISRVRNVINSKSGVSQRIASDSGRNFILKEDALVGTKRKDLMEGKGSNIECELETSSPEENGGDEPTDLLAAIRARKDAEGHGAVVARTQHQNILMHQPRRRESGTAWASKVLEGNGGLLLRTRIPGDSEIPSDSQLSLHSDDDSALHLEEQQRIRKQTNNSPPAKRVILTKEATAVDDSTSDDDEWEEGDQPGQHDSRTAFGEGPVRNDVLVSNLEDTDNREEHAKAFRSLPHELVSGKGEPDCRDPMPGQYHEARPANETEETTGCGGNQMSLKPRSGEVQNDDQGRKELNTEAVGCNIRRKSSNNCRPGHHLSASRGSGSSSDFREIGITNVDDDGRLGTKTSSFRPNTDYPETTPKPAELQTPTTAEEMPSDIEYEEQHAIERSLPVRNKAAEPSFAQLESMQEELDSEVREISRQRSLHRGGAESVADEMYEETRDLIKLFGIPYLEAPMEAEAQCAFLNKQKIVDGVLTEDSDAFLFGALTVYRQLFAEGRFAEEYDANDIQLNLGLDRDNLIRLAYLLGSDYTVGVRGVGIVNSMEILEAFPGSSGLEEFRKWTASVTVLDKEPEEEVMSGSSQEAVRRRFCWKHRNMKRNWEVREGFPNPAVFEAYANPVVDSNRERFSWGPVDFEGLARFCWDKFGWEKDRFESALGPLRQQLRERSGTTQRRIDEFFKPHHFAKIKSERLQRAVHGMAGDGSKELMTANRLDHVTMPSAKRRRKTNPVTYSTELSDQTEERNNPATTE